LISKQIRELLRSGSAIRRVWTLGQELAAVHGAEKIADMTLGNPTAPPPQALVRALEEIVADPPDGLHRYTPNAGHPQVRERVAEHLDRCGILPGAKAGHVVMTAGACAATNVALRAVLEPGDEVLLLAPYFPDYPAHALNHGGVPVVVPTDREFLPDLGALERALGPRTRALIVNHPNNPTGRQYPEPLLREMAELLRAAGRRNGRPVYLISDEPYREVRFTEEPFVSPARLHEHGLLAYSFSKSHSIPGERIGYLAVNPDLEQADQLVAALAVSNRILGFPNAPSLWQHVISRCLDAGADIETLRGHRDRLVAALREKGYELVNPEGTFYLFPRTPGGDDDAFVETLAKSLVLVVPGETFGQTGFFRMAFCVDQRTVDLAIRLLPPAHSPAARER
jgi:aspartate aminotransferase